MPNTTKYALEESLKRLLLHKPLDKITIQDLTADCGISRMSFYYHFKDIYDLVEWITMADTLSEAPPGSIMRRRYSAFSAALNSSSPRILSI